VVKQAYGRDADPSRGPCAILNSPVLTDLVRPLIAFLKDERQVDKAMRSLPVAAFDPADAPPRTPGGARSTAGRAQCPTGHHDRDTGRGKVKD